MATEDLYLEQLDAKTAFLHGDVEDIYMHQPQGFVMKRKEKIVHKPSKSLNGLKLAPQQWYKKFDNFMCNNGFKRPKTDHYCYTKGFGKSYVILLLYFDDMLIAGSDIEKINRVNNSLSK